MRLYLKAEAVFSDLIYCKFIIDRRKYSVLWKWSKNYCGGWQLKNCLQCWRQWIACWHVERKALWATWIGAMSFHDSCTPLSLISSFPVSKLSSLENCKNTKKRCQELSKPVNCLKGLYLFNLFYVRVFFQYLISYQILLLNIW